MSDADRASSIAPIATIQSYDDLLAACRAQVARLGINYQILDIAAGFTDGYTTKLFAQSEHCSTGGRRSKRHFSAENPSTPMLRPWGLNCSWLRTPTRLPD